MLANATRATPALDTSMDSAYEPVYLISMWYDGPRAGITRFRGEPHLFDSGGLMDAHGPSAPELDQFYLTPIPRASLALMLERAEIRARWVRARAQGLVVECEDALPVDRPRFDAIEEELAAHPFSRANLRLVRGTFRLVPQAERASGDGAWEARWVPITSPTHDDGRLRPFRRTS